MAMRTASSLERAEEQLKSALQSLPPFPEVPQLLIGLIPVFWKELSVDIRNADVVQSVRTFTPTQSNPVTSFAGLDRVVHADGSKVQVHRNGLLVVNRRLSLVTVNDDPRRFFYVEAIDDMLHGLVTAASRVYQAAGVGGPFLLGMILRYNAPLVGAFPEGNIPGAVIIR